MLWQLVIESFVVNFVSAPEFFFPKSAETADFEKGMKSELSLLSDF